MRRPEAGFAKHASLPAIEWQLKQARRRQREADRMVTWLTELLTERTAQIVAGTWPPKRGEDG